jgi:flagellar FliJ protein
MKKFRFSLQKVLDHRERLTSLAKETLIKARAERDAAEERLESAITQRDEALQARRAVVKPGIVNIELVRAHLSRCAGVDSDVRSAAQTVAVAQHTFDRHAQVYVERKRDVKAMELLKDKRAKEHAHTVKAEEQRIMDESFNARYFRTMQDRETA